MKRGVTYKYDVYDGEEYVGTYTAREVAELTGISKKLVSEYANAFRFIRIAGDLNCHRKIFLTGSRNGTAHGRKY